MQILSKLSLLVVVLSFPLSALQSQTTILDQSLLTQNSFDSFTAVSVTGDQNWYFNPAYGAVCSGYNSGQSHENEDWLVGPAMDLSPFGNAKLTFSHTRGNAGVMNAGVAQGWYKAYATANYTGDPATTQWIDLTGLNQNITTAWQYIFSGELSIPQGAISANSRIAFRYISSASQSATWEIKNVKVTGESLQNPGSDSVFKITNWNIEWLGCTSYGPSNETLQVNNVVSAMLMMNSDIYCIQEVSNTATIPSIQTLVSLLGSDQWAGNIVPSNTGDCNQRQGIIYKKSKVQLVNASEMSNGPAAQGYSYYYNWTSGRYPALYNVNLIAGNTMIPISLVNIHAKAEDGNATSYIRRLGASEGLKTILDGIYDYDNVIVIGDFNDYLIGTTSDACECTLSPYKNFMDDETNYNGISKYISDANSSWGTHPIIEHMIISNELFDHYIENSTAQETTLLESISNYNYTTSDHLPVSALFQFSTLSNPEFTSLADRPWNVSQNPVSDELKINFTTPMLDTTTSIYDLTGRQMSCGKINQNTIDVSMLPTGIYILKIGNKSAKFVKN